jgi:hypothetical protein
MPPELDEYCGFYITVISGRFKEFNSNWYEGYRATVWDADGNDRRVYTHFDKDRVIRWAKLYIDTGPPKSMLNEKECVIELIHLKNLPTEETYEVD